MQIAILGTGNVGGALATNWSAGGHTINLGVKDLSHFKGVHLLNNENTYAFEIGEAVKKSEVVLVATPPAAIFDLIELMGDVSGKTIIDATNAVRQSPEPYPTVYHCLADKTNAEIVKCFNSTGYENLLNPVYHGQGIDMFMAGDSEMAKKHAEKLAMDAGFGSCMDFGKGDKVELLEKFALS
jgi:predicted dinucleotide-binding enzyme